MGEVDRLILAALDQAPATVAVLRGPELRYTYFNDLYRHVAPGLQIGDSFGVDTEQGQRFRELAFQVVHSGQQLQLHELPVTLKSGVQAYFDLLLHPLRNQNGEFDGVILIGTDVTKSVESRRALEAQSERAHRAEAQLTTLLERGPFSVITLDPSGRVLYIGGGGIYRRGQDPVEIVGRNALELYQDDPAVLSALRRALTGEVFSTLVQRPSVTYEVFYSPVRDAAGALEMIVGVGVDVSRRLRAEEERARIHDKMLQTQKLESLGVLAGGIAHDFNNLLTVIQGNAQVALARLADKDPVRDPIDDILRAALRASDLTRQMLAYSGKGRFQIGPLDLRQQVSEIGNLLRTSISKKVALRIEQPSFLSTVQGDASQLQQVVMNLVLNAAEAVGSSEGEVKVGLGEEEVGGDGGGDLIGRERLPEGRYVRLTVEDTGAGMDPQIQARIFDPFFTTKSAGRGLGLAAVLGIVRSHGGAIRIASTPGRGTRFEVLLPAAGARAQSPTSNEPLAAPGKGTVLVIDDEDSVRIASGRMLSMLGYDVLEAADGEQGIEILKLRNGDIDVVLLDVTMPGLSGEETLELVRAIDPQMPVIVFSGYAEDEVAARLRPLHPAAVLQKPFTRQQLGAALQLALK
jgi:signal transduction histidine kinase/CheY-like chemotaxis protein